MSLSAMSTCLLSISRNGSHRIFPGQPILMLDNLIVEEMFPNSQTTSPAATHGHMATLVTFLFTWEKRPTLTTGHETCAPNPSPAPLSFSGHAPTPQCEGPRTGHRFWDVASAVLSTGVQSLLCWRQYFCHKPGCCWAPGHTLAQVQLPVPGPFLWRAFQPCLFKHEVLGLLWPKYRAQHFTFLSLIELSSAHWCSLYRSLCRAFLHSSRLTHTPAWLYSPITSDDWRVL